ncbi:hypothetical protein NAS92_14920, partial [Pantoea brenneri]|nr:hypothetical protein [Pantoea brenneri]
CVEQDDKGWDARKRAYCLKIQPATGSFARNLIYSTKPAKGAEVIVRSQSPCLTAEQFAEINISGWQQQRSDGELISC